MSTPLLALFALLLAPITGSFIGVMVERMPTGRPLGFARSSCDGCGVPLTARDLVPLASWLVRGGRCRCRETRLSRFYPLIELAAVVVALWALLVAPDRAFWPSLLLGWTLLALAAIDLRHFVLPDQLTLPLVPVGLAITWLMAPDALLDHAVGAAVGLASFATIAWGYRRWRGRDGLGLGDAKLLAGAGAWLGWQALPDVVVIGAVSALVVALAASLRGREVRGTTRVAFGPHLALAFWLVWLYGPLIAA